MVGCAYLVIIPMPEQADSMNSTSSNEPSNVYYGLTSQKSCEKYLFLKSTIVINLPKNTCNSPMRELIGSVMVSSPLLPAFGTLSHLLYFRLPSIFLPSKGRSITTLGTDQMAWFFFIILIRGFIKLHLFSFSYAMQTQERTHCACSVFPFIKKKKKKKKTCQIPF